MLAIFAVNKISLIRYFKRKSLAQFHQLDTIFDTLWKYGFSAWQKSLCSHKNKYVSPLNYGLVKLLRKPKLCSSLSYSHLINFLFSQSPMAVTFLSFRNFYHNEYSFKKVGIDLCIRSHITNELDHNLFPYYTSHKRNQNLVLVIIVPLEIP